MANNESMTVREALDDGDRRQQLEAIARGLADRLDSPDTLPAYVPSLAARLLEVLDKIKYLDAQTEQAEREAALRLDVAFDPSVI